MTKVSHRSSVAEQLFRKQQVDSSILSGGSILPRLIRLINGLTLFDDLRSVNNG